MPVYANNLKLTELARLDRIQYRAAKLVSGALHFTNREQDLVFSVKLQFGKPLVSVQKKFALQKVFCSKIFGPKTNISSKKNFCFKIFKSVNKFFV